MKKFNQKVTDLLNQDSFEIQDLLKICSEFLPETKEEFISECKVFCIMNEKSDRYDFIVNYQIPSEITEMIERVWDIFIDFNVLIVSDFIINKLHEASGIAIDEIKEILLNKNEFDSCQLSFDLVDEFYKDNNLTNNLAIETFVILNKNLVENFQNLFKFCVKSELNFENLLIKSQPKKDLKDII